MKKAVKVIAHHHGVGSYMFGYLLALLFTVLAYITTTRSSFDKSIVYFLIGLFAVLQLVIQLVYFLHIFQDNSRVKKSYVFAATFIVVGILVFGSVWIMDNLNYHMKQSPDVETEIIKDELIK